MNFLRVYNRWVQSHHGKVLSEEERAELSFLRERAMIMVYWSPMAPDKVALRRDLEAATTMADLARIRRSVEQAEMAEWRARQ
jgi:hypothetical protein